MTRIGISCCCAMQLRCRRRMMPIQLSLLCETFGRASLCGDPFPHLYLPSIFPAPLYRQILAQLPTVEEMQPIPLLRSVREMAQAKRRVLPLRPAELSLLPTSKADFWLRLTAAFTSYDVRRALLQILCPEVVADAEGLLVDMILVRDEASIWIGPHTDGPKRVVTALFYLPEDARAEVLGTRLYVPNQVGFRCPGGVHHPASKFRECALMPYRPNTVFAFRKTDQSFHGVAMSAGALAERRLLMYAVNRSEQA